MTSPAALPTPGPDDGAFVRIFGRLGDRWELTIPERAALLDASSRTYHRWKRDPRSARLSGDQRMRVSHLVNIYLDLHTIFGDVSRADAWVRRPNGYFGGRTPLTELLDGGYGAFVRVFDYVATAAGR